MRKVIAILMIAMIIFHFSLVFNRPTTSFQQSTFKFPTITFKPGIFVPRATLSSGTLNPVVHVHTAFFRFG